MSNLYLAGPFMQKTGLNGYAEYYSVMIKEVDYKVADLFVYESTARNIIEAMKSVNIPA